MVIQKIGNLLQQWLQPDALLQKLQIGKGDLRIGVSHADSFIRLSVKTGPFLWRFSSRCARICASWAFPQSLSKNGFNRSSIRSASWRFTPWRSLETVQHLR